MVFQLFYKSTSAKGMVQQDLDNIITTAVKRNSKFSITGCLVYFDKEFYQILEGNREDVLLLYEDIKKDKRHYDVTLISTEPTQYRIFSKWHMALYFVDEKHNTKKVVDEFRNKVLLLNSLNFFSETALEFWHGIKKSISGDDDKPV